MTYFYNFACISLLVEHEAKKGTLQRTWHFKDTEIKLRIRSQ